MVALLRELEFNGFQFFFPYYTSCFINHQDFFKEITDLYLPIVYTVYLDLVLEIYFPNKTVQYVIQMKSYFFLYIWDGE